MTVWELILCSIFIYVWNSTISAEISQKILLCFGVGDAIYKNVVKLFLKIFTL